MFEVVLASIVVRQMKKLQNPVHERVLDALDELSNNPRPPGSKKLKGAEEYRLRVGDYRVIYAINDERQQVIILRVGHRREVYR